MPESASTSCTRRNASCARMPVPSGAGRRGSRRHGSATTTAPAGRPGPGQRGEQGPALRPVLPGVVGPAVLVEELGGHPGAAGSGDGAAQGELPVPVCLAVTGTGAVGGPPVERGRHRPERAVPVSRARAARCRRRGVVRDPASLARTAARVVSCHRLSFPCACSSGGGRARCAGREQAGTQRAGSTVVPGLRGGLQVRPLSARSLACAISWARSSRARTARAAPGVSCGSAGVKVTSITSASPGLCGGRGLRGRAARDGSAVMPAPVPGRRA